MVKKFKDVYAISQRSFTKLVNILKQYMNRVLKLSDFKWIIINQEKEEGYYSFKENEREIAFDWCLLRGWSVYFCNKFEEVLEEYGCRDEEEALEIANKLYKSSVV